MPEKPDERCADDTISLKDLIFERDAFRVIFL